MVPWAYATNHAERVCFLHWVGTPRTLGALQSVYHKLFCWFPKLNEQVAQPLPNPASPWACRDPGRNSRLPWHQPGRQAERGGTCGAKDSGHKEELPITFICDMWCLQVIHCQTGSVLRLRSSNRGSRRLLKHFRPLVRLSDVPPDVRSKAGTTAKDLRIIDPTLRCRHDIWKQLPLRHHPFDSHNYLGSS